MMINFGYKLKQIVATNLVDIYFPKQIAVPTFGGFQTRKKGRPQSKEILITEEGEKIKEKGKFHIKLWLVQIYTMHGNEAGA